MALGVYFSLVFFDQFSNEWIKLRFLHVIYLSSSFGILKTI